MKQKKVHIHTRFSEETIKRIDKLLPKLNMEHRSQFIRIATEKFINDSAKQ